MDGMLCFYAALIVYAALYSARRLFLDKAVPRSRTPAVSCGPQVRTPVPEKAYAVGRQLDWIVSQRRKD